MKKNSFIPLPPFKGWVLQNFPFIEEDFDAITSYQLWCKVVEYLRGINSNVNVLAEQVLEIKNYFDNLDVQEEINNKLDEMAKSGQLTDIIAQYLQLAGILAYNTINDLKNAENIVDGSFTKTYGNLEYNDGYGAFYKIRQLVNTDVIDEVNLVALNNFPTLVAEKMPDKNIEKINEYISYEKETERYTNNFRYYVDGVNGNDSNDGLTEETAFKTIDKFLSMANVRSDIRCFIISAGTYTISKTNLEHCSIHITSNLPNKTDVILTNPNDEFVFYQCHINFRNITIENVDYFEGCSCAFYDCLFPTYFQFIGSTAFLDGCKINAIKGDKSNLKIRNITIDGYSKEDSDPLYMYDSIMDLYGTINYEELIEDATYIFGGYFSTITMHGTINVTSGSTYNYSRIFLNQSTLYLSTNDFNTLSATYTFQRTRSLIIKDNTNLPS